MGHWSGGLVCLLDVTWLSRLIVVRHARLSILMETAGNGKERPMPDDPNKRGKADRSRVSKQEHEQRYAAKRKLAAKTTNGRKKK
jgi:hypothetical protein